MRLYKDFDLAPILWYRIGGKARFLLEVSNTDDFINAIAFIKNNEIERYFMLGSGSNLIFTDDYFDGAIIRAVPGNDSIVEHADGTIEAFSGEELDRVIQFAFLNRRVGLEWAGGLPGTVGAAVRGNVGAFGGEIKDVVTKALVLQIQDRSIEKILMDTNELEFGYRQSIVKMTPGMLVSSVIFDLKHAAVDEVSIAHQVYEGNINYRQVHHPLDYPSCGSVFKNISKKEDVTKILEVYSDIQTNVETKWHGKVSMGYLIKRLGLSGFRIGNAQVSEKHSNFIINLGGAKAADVLRIIETIQERFSEIFELVPEVEVEIVK